MRFHRVFFLACESIGVAKSRHHATHLVDVEIFDDGIETGVEIVQKIHHLHDPTPKLIFKNFKFDFKKLIKKK